MKTYPKYILMAGMALTLILQGIISLPSALADAAPSGLHQFDGTGVLHDIRPDGVVINDIYLRLAPGVEFKSPDAKHFAQASFRRGDYVGYFKDESGRVTVLWHLLKQR